MSLKSKLTVPITTFAWLSLYPPEASAQEAGATPAPQPAVSTAAPESALPEPERAGPRKAEEEVVVTGSRIRRKDLTTPAPVSVISRETVQASGKVSIGDFLQSLPEQGNSINTQVNNGGNGATRVA